MSAKDLRALERRFINAGNKGKAAVMAAIDEVNATNIVVHTADGRDIRGIKDAKQYLGPFFGAFPDVHFTIDDIVVEGDKAVVRWTWTGTHKSEFMGIPATNKKMTGWTIQIDRIIDGKFVEIWERMDTLGFMQQLGVIPTPGKGK
jgi:steroid delta-isomerase-like uncharacterized protein